MKTNIDIITQMMVQATNEFFVTEELKKIAYDCIMYKTRNKFPFGELTILHYQMFEGNSPDIPAAAAAVELMILSLDIFDDLQDNDNFSVPWTQINPAVSMNLATGFLVLGMKVLEKTSFEKSIVSRAISDLYTQVLKAVNGQHLDLKNTFETSEDYLHMVEIKSGSLLASACLVGTTLANPSYNEIVSNYAVHMGIIAQLKNDLQDISRWDEKNDLLNKKKTLPTLYLLQNQQRQFDIIRDYYNGKIEAEKLFKVKKTIHEIIRKSGVFEYMEVMIRVHQLKATELIHNLDIEVMWKEKLYLYI